MNRKGLSRVVLAASVAISLMATAALGLSLTPRGQQALRSLAAAAGSRIFPWAPVIAMADTTCQPPSTGGGNPPPPNTGGGTPCAPPAVVVSPSATSVCTGGSVSLTALPSGGTLPETFAWTSSDGSFTSTSQTITVSPTATTTYMVTVTDSSSPALTATASATVTVNPLPSVTIVGAPAGAIVLGTVVSLGATVSGGTNPFTWAWTKAGAAFATTPLITDTPPLGDTIYAVTVTDANGCASPSAAVTVRVFDYTISLSPASETVLAGTPATYTASLTLAAGSDTTGGASSVALSITGAPAGATVVAPATLDLTGPGSTGTVTVTTTSLGDFTLFASGSTGGTTRTSSGAGLHVYDFTLVVAPATQTVTLGGGPAVYTISSTLVAGSTAIGLPASVNLAVIGLPGTVTPTFPASIGLPGSGSLSLAIGATPPGDYPFTVTGAVPGGGRSAAGDLKIAFNVCVLYDQTQVKKSGSTIPIKLQLCDAHGVNVSSPNIVVHAVYLQYLSGSVPNVTPDDSGNANPDNDFRFVGIGTTGGYIFNLSTKGLAPGVWAMFFTAGSDPTFHSVQFVLK